jgi:hypothetical protein
LKRRLKGDDEQGEHRSEGVMAGSDERLRQGQRRGSEKGGGTGGRRGLLGFGMGGLGAVSSVYLWELVWAVLG